jgi:hypothetical protein
MLQMGSEDGIKALRDPTGLRRIYKDTGDLRGTANRRNNGSGRTNTRWMEVRRNRDRKECPFKCQYPSHCSPRSYWFAQSPVPVLPHPISLPIYSASNFSSTLKTEAEDFSETLGTI